MAITQPIDGFTVTPLRTNPATFSADTDTYHIELSTFISQIQTWTTQLNDTEANVNSKATQVENDASQVSNDKTQTESLKNETENIYNQFIDLSNSKGLFESTTEGLLNTNNGELFSVFGADSLKYDIYLNDNNTAIFKSSVYTKEYIDNATQNVTFFDISRAKTFLKNGNKRFVKNNGIDNNDIEILSGQMFSPATESQLIPFGSFTSFNRAIAFSFYGETQNVTSAWLKINDYSFISIRSSNLYLDSATMPLTTGLNLLDGNYYRIVLNITQNNVTVFVNGVENNTVSFTNPNASGSDFFWTRGSGAQNWGNIIHLNNVNMTEKDVATDFNNPELIFKTVKNTEVSSFSFSTSDIISCYPMQDGAKGAGNLQDIKNNTSFSISNYNANMWDNAKNLSYGIQQCLLKKDNTNNFVLDSGSFYSSENGSIEGSDIILKSGFTISFVFKKPDFSLIQSLFYFLGLSDFGLNVSSSANNFSLVENNITLHTEAISADTYYHVAIAYSGTKLNLFVNTLSIYESYLNISNNKTFKLGNSATSNINSDVEIKYLKIWNKELNLFEINKEYNDLKTNDSLLALP